MDQDRQAVEGQKLLGLRAGHPCAQPRGGKYRKYLHNGWSIHRRGIAGKGAALLAGNRAFRLGVSTPQRLQLLLVKDHRRKLEDVRILVLPAI